MVGPSTYSIVGCDLEAGEYGVAVQSKFFAVGAGVPHARAGAGAIATQGWFDPGHGLEALRLLTAGETAESVLTQLLSGAAKANALQFGIVDSRGEGAGYTGVECAAWAGHEVGTGFACQGNSLAGPQVLAAMRAAFGTAAAPLPERLLAALAAGEAAGGDRRGRQSAALYVARAHSGFSWRGDRYIDIRVDDHPDPIAELERLLRQYRAEIWGRLKEPLVVLDRELLLFVQAQLRRQGYLAGEVSGVWDPPTEEAVQALCVASGLDWLLPFDGVTLPQSLFQHLFA